MRVPYKISKTHGPKRNGRKPHTTHKIQRTHIHTMLFDDPKDVTKFVCRQNEKVRVDEDSLTDKDVRVKRSDRGSRSLRGPMEVPVEERL